MDRVKALVTKAVDPQTVSSDIVRTQTLWEGTEDRSQELKEIVRLAALNQPSGEQVEMMRDFGKVLEHMRAEKRLDRQAIDRLMKMYQRY
jgi:hypothetical protein